MEPTSSKEPSECRRERVAWVRESDMPMLESAVTCFVCWAGAAQQLKGRSIKDSNTIRSIFPLSSFLFRCAEKRCNDLLWQKENDDTNVCMRESGEIPQIFLARMNDQEKNVPSCLATKANGKINGDTQKLMTFFVLPVDIPPKETSRGGEGKYI
jgi:hypothetical protein